MSLNFPARDDGDNISYTTWENHMYPSPTPNAAHGVCQRLRGGRKMRAGTRPAVTLF